MRTTRYRYNPSTCRYEPIPFRIHTILIPVLILLAVSLSFSLLLLLMHSAYITTDKELTLKAENRLLSFHHERISASLREVNASLVTLKRQDESIQQKLLAAQLTNKPEQAKKIIDVPPEMNTRQYLMQTQSRTSSILKHSRGTSYYFGETIHFTNESRSLLSNLPTIFPVEIHSMDQVASGFGLRRNPFHKGTYHHEGIDFIASRDASVFATASGKVISVRKSDMPAGEGNSIEIDHGNGFKTRYTHLGNMHVKRGSLVSKGQVIAQVGISGGSAAPHLHYEIINDQKAVDPAGYIMENLSSSEYASWLTVTKRKNQSLD
jgi:murein DD-endopeptidase MepM/ murein hydrolase activator NlpD